MIYIYGLVDPRDNRIRYVGKTKNLNSRLDSHLREANRNIKTFKNNWIKHLLSKNLNPSIIILEECLDSNWQEREKYWISYYKELYEDLTNGTDGGEGLNNPSQDIRDKISKANKGMIASDELKKIRSINATGSNNPFYGRKHSDETKEKLRQHFTGKKHTNKTKKILSDMSKGRIVTVEIKANELRARLNNKDGYLGVYKHKKNNKWIANIKINNKQIYLGSFVNLTDAAKEYDKQARIVYGDYAVLNFPQE